MSDKNPKHPLKKKKVHEKICVANHSEEEMQPKSKKHVYN